MGFNGMKGSEVIEYFHFFFFVLMVVIGNYMVGRCQRVCVALQSVVCLTCFIKFCRVPQGETELVEIKGRLELRQGT